MRGAALRRSEGLAGSCLRYVRAGGDGLKCGVRCCRGGGRSDGDSLPAYAYASTQLRQTHFWVQLQVFPVLGRVLGRFLGRVLGSAPRMLVRIEHRARPLPEPDGRRPQLVPEGPSSLSHPTR